jgi:hypothetical protein
MVTDIGVVEQGAGGVMIVDASGVPMVLRSGSYQHF